MKRWIVRIQRSARSHRWSAALVDLIWCGSLAPAVALLALLIVALAYQAPVAGREPFPANPSPLRLAGVHRPEPAAHGGFQRCGPPWWFFDSVNGMRRYFAEVIETAGVYNTAGFNDDTRAFASIPARHDLWRRVSCDWLAGLVAQGLLAEDEALELARELAYGLAWRAYCRESPAI